VPERAGEVRDECTFDLPSYARARPTRNQVNIFAEAEGRQMRSSERGPADEDDVISNVSCQ
jgi:hypothetical protein